jgi:hypothetical protein
MPRAAVPEGAVAWIDDGAEHRADRGTRNQRGEPAERREHVARGAALQEQRPAGTAELAHHRSRGQPAADDVTHDDPVETVGQIHDVVPVAADLQCAGRGLVVDGEVVGQDRRPEDGALQGDGHVGEELRPRSIQLCPFRGAAALVLDRLRVSDRRGHLPGGQRQEGPVLLVQLQVRAGAEHQRPHR